MGPFTEIRNTKEKRILAAVSIAVGGASYWRKILSPVVGSVTWEVVVDLKVELSSGMVSLQ